MKVLLQADVDNVGRAGEIASVREGFARNFLLPRKLAILADEKNMRAFEHAKRQTEEKVKKLRKAAETVKEKIEALTLTIPCKTGEEGKLFGSVTNSQLADELKKQGFDIDRRKIVLEHPLKALGSHQLRVKLESGVEAALKVELVNAE